jgi:LysR family glycine cleavage system transcriptional activator
MAAGAHRLIIAETTEAIGVASPAASRLPPLNLFRTFDAVVRYRSFRFAADELCVTPSAVSQQIRQLEEQLHIRLFRRLPRRIELTREGAALATTVREAIAMLSGACDLLVNPAQPTVICVSVAPALASRWLVRRLKAFMAAHPSIRVMLQATNDDIDFKRQDIDVGIRWGMGPWPGCRAELLVPDIIVPVCTPSYQRDRGLEQPGDLCRATQLHVVGQGNQWADWFGAAGLRNVSFDDILYFSDGALMLEAAADGQGICLASSLLVAHELASGRLVRPFGAELRLREGYHVLVDEATGDRPASRTFREWVLNEALASVSTG